MAAVKFLLQKYVSVLPATLEPNTMYMVKRGTGFDIHVTNANGLPVAYPLNLRASGSNGQVQYNSSGDLAGAQNVIVNNQNLFLKDSTPNTLSDHLGLFGIKQTGLLDLYSGDAVAGIHRIQRYIGDNAFSGVFFQGSGTSLNTAIGASLTAVGTARTRALTATKFGQIRTAAQYTGTLVSDVAGWYSPRQVCWRGNAAGTGGFYFNVGFAITDVTYGSDGRTFVGLSTSVAAPSYVNPFSITNAMGVGQDPTAPQPNNLYLFITGTSATVAAIATPFLASASEDFLLLEIFVPPNSTMIYMTLTSLVSGTVSTTSFNSTTLAANQFPSNAAFFSPRMWRSNGGAFSNSGQIDVSHYTLEVLT